MENGWIRVCAKVAPTTFAHYRGQQHYRRTCTRTSSSRSGASVLGLILKIFGEPIRGNLRFPELVPNLYRYKFVQVQDSANVVNLYRDLRTTNWCHFDVRSKVPKTNTARR